MGEGGISRRTARGLAQATEGAQGGQRYDDEVRTQEGYGWQSGGQEEIGNYEEKEGIAKDVLILRRGLLAASRRMAAAEIGAS